MRPVSYGISHLTLTTTRWSRFYYPHLTDEDTEVQRGHIPQSVMELNLNVSVYPRAYVLTIIFHYLPKEKDKRETLMIVTVRSPLPSFFQGSVEAESWETCHSYIWPMFWINF